MVRKYLDRLYDQEIHDLGTRFEGLEKQLSEEVDLLRLEIKALLLLLARNNPDLKKRWVEIRKKMHQAHAAI